MKKIFLVLAALFLFSGCQKEEAETVETTDATAIETVGEIEETAASESDFLYKITNGQVTINQYIGGESVVVIPETIEGCPVQKVKSDFLKASSVSEVIYPANFTVFEGLSNCPTVKVIRFSSPTEQIIDPFSQCEGLTEIDIPDGGAYRTIDGIVYTADGKTLVAYPRGRTGSFHVPDGVEVIGTKAFYGSRLSELVLSDSVRTIEDCAFTKTEKLMEVTIPASVRTIGVYAFSESGIERVTLSEGLEEIGAWTFRRTKITELYLPDSLVKCGSGIADPEVLISASYPIEGLKPLLLNQNVDFRDETTLQKAFSKAEEQFFEDTSPPYMGYGFIDLSGDRFPEMVRFIHYIMWIYYYDEEARQWVSSSLDDFGAPSYIPIDVYHLCYDNETDTYTYYSEQIHPYATVWDGIPSYHQYIIQITENGVMIDELHGEEIVDLSKAEIIQTVDFPKMLEDWDARFDDPYERFILVTDSFAEEPNGELQQAPLKIHEQQAEAYPYFESYYPKEMRLSVAGIDVLRGEEQLAGVSFDHGALIFENAVIDSSGYAFTIAASGFDELTIELIGENKIVSDIPCSLFKTGDISIVFKGSGSLETPTMEAKRISLTENVKIIENEELSSEDYGIITDSLSLSGESILECREVKADYLRLSNHAYADIQSGRFDEITLQDDSAMNVILNEPSRGGHILYTNRAITVGRSIRISDNARLFVDNSKLFPDDFKYYCQTIFFESYGGHFTISDNGSLEIKGNYAGDGIDMDNGSGTFTVNGNAKVKIDGAVVCIEAERIVLNGGTLELNTAKEGPVIIIDSFTSADAGYFINGEILSENVTDWEMFYNVLMVDEKPVSNYFIQVREREQASE